MKHLEITIKGKRLKIPVEEVNNQIWFHLDGRIFVLNPKNPPSRTKSPSPVAKQVAEKQVAKNAGIIRSAMPGQILKVAVKIGDKVKENSLLLVLSSMKMEYVIQAPFSGQVVDIKVKEAQQVTADQILMEIQFRRWQD